MPVGGPKCRPQMPLRACCGQIARKCLLSVAGQNLTAGSADSRPIALEAIEDAENVVVVVLDQLLAEAHDVGTAGGALPCISLALSRRRCDGGQRERSRNNHRTKHQVLLVLSPLCGGLCHSCGRRDTALQPSFRRLRHGVVIAHRMARTCAAMPPRDKACARAVSSVGRASALHAECRRFESVTAHQCIQWLGREIPPKEERKVPGG